MRDTVFEQVKALIASELKVKEEEISFDSHFTKDLNADSLDVVEFIMSLEEKFDIKIPDEDAEKMQTVGDAVEYIINAKKGS